MTTPDPQSYDEILRRVREQIAEAKPDQIERLMSDIEHLYPSTPERTDIVH